MSVILVSELGDKTFFIAAILAMTNNKITVFLSAISALATMTVLSALLGFVVTTFIPTIYTYYTCTAIMFIFGLKMLWDGFRMKSNEAEEIQNEVAMEITNRLIGKKLQSIHYANQAGDLRCTGGRKGVSLGCPGREAYMQVYMYKNKF